MRNRKIHIILLILPFLFLLSFSSIAQDAIMFDQNVMKQEFMNPAYNSFKDYVSVSLMSRHQWFNKLSGAPETYAANIYVPISLSGFGVGIMAIKESIGLRKKVSFSGSFSHNLRVSYSDYLALGYGFGLQNLSYDMDRIVSYPDVNLNEAELNAAYMTASLGAFFYDPVFFLGASSNFLINTDRKYSNSGILPGVDFTSGFMYSLNNNVLISPDMVLKYYPIKMYQYDDGVKRESKADPILDVGINFLLAEKLWLGTSHRLGQAQTFSFVINIKDSFKLGYTFELGIGKGINQFNSHGVILTWSLVRNRALNGFVRSGRYNMNGRMNSHLYR